MLREEFRILPKGRLQLQLCGNHEIQRVPLVEAHFLKIKLICITFKQKVQVKVFRGGAKFPNDLSNLFLIKLKKRDGDIVTKIFVSSVQPAYKENIVVGTSFLSLRVAWREPRTDPDDFKIDYVSIFTWWKGQA